MAPPENPNLSPTGRDEATFIGELDSHLCSLGMRHWLLSGFYKDFLQNCFSQPANVEEFNLRQYLWQDADWTSILIESSFRFDPRTTQKRPAILIKRNEFQQDQQVIGNLGGITRQMDRQYMTMWHGSHTIFCIHASGQGAQILGGEVARKLTHFTDDISKKLHLSKYRVLQIGEVAQLEEQVQDYVVPVTVGVSYTENWVLHEEALPLARISFETLLNG